MENKTMNVKCGYYVVLAVFFLLFSSISNAADSLAKEDLEKLISGNTAEGKT